MFIGGDVRMGVGDGVGSGRPDPLSFETTVGSGAPDPLASFLSGVFCWDVSGTANTKTTRYSRICIAFEIWAVRTVNNHASFRAMPHGPKASDSCRRLR